ncbi:MAG: MFS transporter [Pseudomonadota bacterium]
MPDLHRPHTTQSTHLTRLPFFYGWVILGCVCAAGFARQGPAVATLSVFIEPMTDELGWSRTAISGAVSLGGILAAILSPMLGPLLDRHGARVMLVAAVLASGLSVMAISQVETLLLFYVCFVVGRMCFAGPFDLGIYGAINSWFVMRRPMATAIATTAQMIGLTAMPLIATAATTWSGDDWRMGWIAVGTTVLVVGLLPNLLLMVRSPEDVGLQPDGRNLGDPSTEADTKHRTASVKEPDFTRAEALRRPAFWLLSLFTLLVFPVQAGVSLHQAPHLIESGIDPTIAATVVSTFSVLSAISGLLFGAVARRLSVRVLLVIVGLSLGASALMMIGVTTALWAYAAAAVFGVGIGGLLTMLPIAWADFFGRRSFGAIRGIALTVQVVAQAAGPILSGYLRDLTGDYTMSLATLGALGLASAGIALFARPPERPNRAELPKFAPQSKDSSDEN